MYYPKDQLKMMAEGIAYARELLREGKQISAYEQLGVIEDTLIEMHEYEATNSIPATDEIRAALRELKDERDAVSMLTGLSTDEIDNLGGVPRPWVRERIQDKFDRE